MNPFSRTNLQMLDKLITVDQLGVLESGTSVSGPTPLVAKDALVDRVLAVCDLVRPVGVLHALHARNRDVDVASRGVVPDAVLNVYRQLALAETHTGHDIS
jgi:hypothetical protein